MEIIYKITDFYLFVWFKICCSLFIVYVSFLGYFKMLIINMFQTKYKKTVTKNLGNIYNFEIKKYNRPV